MPTTLNRKAYQELIDADIEWLQKQPQSIERVHILLCMAWCRANKPLIDANPSEPPHTPDNAASDAS